MSSVRMCDSCGIIFSENDDGWTTFTGNRRIKEDGRSVFKEIVQDSCAGCSEIVFNDKPRIPLNAGSRASTRTQILNDDDDH